MVARFRATTRKMPLNKNPVPCPCPARAWL
jgi:hypothetical protein